jgi:ParB family transcriptional regulator, chromosome partitioning protein
MAAPKKGGLGRGLGALIADAAPVEINPTPAVKEEKAEAGDRVRYIKTFDIMPNENQPRKTFDEDKIQDLANSILEHGVIQPIVLREKGKGYEIVAGERRWRAAIKAGLTEVPCLIRELDDEQNMLIAIIENMQREDLNPIEEAEGLNRMVSVYGMTQEQVSKSVGKSRPYITNSLRLLRLPDYVKELVSEGKLSAAHGRTVITIEDEDERKKLCDKIVKEGLSVRETERLAALIGQPRKKKPAKKTKNANVAKVERELKDVLGTKVNINQNGSKGKIEIEYFSKDELERLLDMLKSLRK